MLLADVSQVSLSGTICKSDGQRFKKMICKIKSIIKYDILSSIQMSERTHSLLYIFPLSTPDKKWVSSQAYFRSTHGHDHELLIYDTNLENSIM